MNRTSAHSQGVQERSPDAIETRDYSWRYWFLLPIYPYRHRRTLRREVVQNTIWTFDQVQGIFYTVVPIRMTVIKLEAGGLLVYAPIAPTPECIRLVKELEAEHGEVRYLILSTTSGLEHKVFVAPFARHFPNAQLFVAPNQWSFPLNLPLSWLGFPRDRTHILPENSADAPFADEFDYAVLDIDLGRGSFADVALLHKRSHTLLVTDIVQSIPETPPAIVQFDPYPLLFHARESALEPIQDTEANRRKGWHRTALFALYFQPSALKPAKFGQAIREAFKAPDRSKKAYFGFFPFQWESGWERSFEALRGNGRPFIAPILQTLILDHDLPQVLSWADKVASWQFDHIIPGHLDAPIATTPEQFRQAFSVFEQSGSDAIVFGSTNHPLPHADIELIKQLEENLERLGIAASPK